MSRNQVTFLFNANVEQFQKNMRSMQRNLQKFERQAMAVGKGLTQAVTLPIIGLGAGMLKMAIDAEETSAKFATAFAGIEAASQQAVDRLTRDFGLATTEAEGLLAGTGDLLKGFGATTREALALSAEVQALSVDLASYNNIQGGAQAASNAVTAALLGEREQMKQLGVVIREADVQQQLLANGQADLTGQAKLLATAQATLQLITQQSGDAIGDYARTSGSAANQTRQLMSSAKDIAVLIGNDLLPAYQSLLNGLNRVGNFLRNLTSEQRRFVVVAATVAASIGPITIALALLVKGIGILVGAFATMKVAAVTAWATAFAPVTAALAAIAAVITAVVYLRENWDALAERVGDWSWWQNTLISMLQAVTRYNPFSLMIKGWNAMARYVGDLNWFKDVLIAMTRAVIQASPFGILSKQLDALLLVAETKLDDIDVRIPEIPNPYEGAIEAIEELRMEQKEYELELTGLGKSFRNVYGDLTGLFAPPASDGGRVEIDRAVRTQTVAPAMPNLADLGSTMSLATPDAETEDAMRRMRQRMNELRGKAEVTGQQIGAALGNAAGQAADAFGQLLSGQATGGEFFNSILKITADFVGQFGKMLIGAGIAAKAFSGLLANPPAAIAAGAALVAISGAIKGLLSAGPGGASGGGGGQPGGGFVPRPTIQPTTDGPIMLPATPAPTDGMGSGRALTGTLKADGRDLVAIIQEVDYVR